MDIGVRALNGFLMLCIPLALGAILARRLRLGWGLFGVGAATFVGSQVLHLPFNGWVLAPAVVRLSLAKAESGWPLVCLATIYGLLAGLFEEGARYVVYRFWAREARSWRQGVMFGAGHGGIEAILLGLLALYTLFQAIGLRGTDLAAVVPPEYLELARQQLEAYWAAPWYEALLGAAERASALCIQIGLALLVLQVFTRHNPAWMAMAVGWHTLVDALAVYGIRTWGVYITEGVVVLCALVSVGLIFGLRTPEPASVEAKAPRHLTTTPKREDVRPERLDDTRYTS